MDVYAKENASLMVMGNHMHAYIQNNSNYFHHCKSKISTSLSLSHVTHTHTHTVYPCGTHGLYNIRISGARYSPHALLCTGEYGAGRSPGALWAEASAYNMHVGASLLKLSLKLSIIRCTLLDRIWENPPYGIFCEN